MQGTLATRKNWVDHINWTSGINQKQSSGGVQNVKKFCKVHRKIPEPRSFTKKKSLVQVHSCEFCKIFKNIFFYMTPLMAASVKYQCLNTQCLYLERFC